MDNNADLWALIGENARILLFIQKCPQFSQKLSASIACMLATFSMSAPNRVPVGGGGIVGLA